MANCAHAGANNQLAWFLTVFLAAAWFVVLRFVLTQPKKPSEAEPGGSKDRDPLLDNAKFLLMPFVVFTHASVYDWDGMMPFQHFVNPWHIKTYAFISGLLARKPPSERIFKSMVFRLILPNLLYCVALSPFMELLVRTRLPKDLSEVTHMWYNGFFYGRAGTNWFLWGLTWWQVIGFMLQSFPPLLRMILAIAISAAGGYDPESLFSWTMAIPTMPNYVAGQIFPWEEVLSRWPLQGRRNFAVGAALMASLFWLETYPGGDFMNDIPTQSWAPHQPWYHWKYQQPACTIMGRLFLWVRGALFRNALELTKSLIFLLCLCPRGASFMSTLGQYTLYPMLIHPPFSTLQLRLFAEPGAWSLPYPSNFWLRLCVWAALLCYCFLTTVVLSSWPTRMIFQVFIQPTWAERCVESASECEGKFSDAFLVAEDEDSEDDKLVLSSEEQ